MCGIVGYLTTKSKLYQAEKIHFMRFALMLDTLRGHDSTGIMTVNRDFKVHVDKTTMPGDRYVNSKQFKDRYVNGWCSVGHNRAATIGKSTLKNAHPFSDGPITLVHNGTLWAGGRSLPKVNKDLEVDSAQIAHNFAEHDPEEAGEVIKEIDGAFALVWFDERDKSVNMCRNDDRPMSFTVNRDRDIMWFMSDPEHLRVINKSFLNRSSAHGTCVYKLDKNHWLKWKRGSLVPEVTTFVPFSFATRQRRINEAKAKENATKKKSDDSSGTTALERATNTWKKQLEARRGAKSRERGYTGPRVKLGGMLRKVPEPMLDALKDEYNLTPESFMRFTPDGSTPYGDKNMVWGEVDYPEWQSSWKAVVMDAATLQINAYANRDWVVQPIGICHPWEKKSTTPAILCSLVHCDWEGYEERLAQEEEEFDKAEEAQASGKGHSAPDPEWKAHTTRTEQEDVKSSWIVGPDRELMPYSKVEKHLENGCVSCGSNLTVGELERCIWVNNHQDILCKACIEDFHQAAPYDSTSVN